MASPKAQGVRVITKRREKCKFITHTVPPRGTGQRHEGTLLKLRSFPEPLGGWPPALAFLGERSAHSPLWSFRVVQPGLADLLTLAGGQSDVTHLLGLLEGSGRPSLQSQALRPAHGGRTGNGNSHSDWLAVSSRRKGFLPLPVAGGPRPLLAPHQEG